VVYGGDNVATNLQGKSDEVSIDSMLDALFRVSKRRGEVSHIKMFDFKSKTRSQTT
jgi:hypothetical protein